MAQIQERYEDSQLYKIRHSAAHVMAQAVMEVVPLPAAAVPLTEPHRLRSGPVQVARCIVSAKAVVAMHGALAVPDRPRRHAAGPQKGLIGMNTWTSIGAVAAIVVATLTTGANAASLSGAGTFAKPSADTLIEATSGSHRDCRYSTYQGYHRHIGSYNRAISCDEQVQHRRSARRDHRRDRRLYVEQPSYYGYGTYYGGGSSSCHRHWHCERTGLFGLDKYCYWRQVCD